MIIRNVTRWDLERALQATSEKFGGNIRWNNGPIALNRKGTAWRCTLRVHNSHGPGAKVGREGRHTIAACWHAHGEFFDALPPGAIIEAAGRKFEAGDPWQDWDCGSLFYPQYMSELCYCGY